MTFTTWVRAQDQFGQFDVRKDDDLRPGVTLVDNYPEHIAQTGRPGKPFVDIGVAAAEGYKGLKKQDLDDEINRRNDTAVIADEVIEVPAKPTIAQLTQLLEEDDVARREAETAAIDASGLEPDADVVTDDDSTSDDDTSDTGDHTNTDAGATGGSEN